MSDNICLDLQAYHNPETLTCELPEASPQPTAQSTTPLPSSLGKFASSNEAFTYRNLEQFTANLTKHAFVRRPQPASTFDSNPAASSILFGVFSLAGCGTKTSGTGGTDGTSNSGTSSGPDVGAAGDDTKGTGDTAGTGGTGPIVDAGSGNGDGNIPGTKSIHDSNLCGDDGTIPDLDDGIGVCANYFSNDHQVFSWDPSTPGEAVTTANLAFAPEQILKGLGGTTFITTYGDASVKPPIGPGLALLTGGAMQHALFPEVVFGSPQTASDGSQMSSVSPAFPKGIAEADNQVFIAASNLQAAESFYAPGTIMVYNTNSDNWSWFQTTDYNPTSVQIINGNLVVVNTGDVTIGGVAKTNSSVDIIDPSTHEIIKNISLGNVGAGVSGEIAHTPDGNTLVLATSDNSGNLIVVDLLAETSRTISVVTPVGEEKVLLTGVTLNEAGDTIYAANFNDGTLYTLGLASGDLLVSPQVLDNNTADFNGISDGLANSAALYMGMGNQIHRLAFD